MCRRSLPPLVLALALALACGGEGRLVAEALVHCCQRLSWSPSPAAGRCLAPTPLPLSPGWSCLLAEIVQVMVTCSP